MESLFDHPELAQYSTELYPGQMVHFENFTTNDIFILVEGQLEVYLSERLITTATEPGTVLLDIVKLLDNYNSVAIKSVTTTFVMRISADDAIHLIDAVPDFSKVISKALVRKISEPQCMVYDCNTFSDQMPDAVVVVDNNEHILSINEAAETLFGYTKDEVEMRPVTKLFPVITDYQEIMSKTEGDVQLREQMITANHPTREKFYVSMSVASLADRNSQQFGYVLICRDITQAKELDNRYKTSKKAIVPFLFIVLMGAIVFAYILPQAFKGYQVYDARVETFKEQLVQDVEALTVIANPVLEGKVSGESVLGQIKAYFSVSLPHFKNYDGFVILGPDKRVVYSKALNEKRMPMVTEGTSYGEFDLGHEDHSVHGVITSYHVSTDAPQGERFTEIVFPVQYNGETEGWFIFIMNMNHLDATFNMQLGDLKEMEIGQDK